MEAGRGAADPPLEARGGTMIALSALRDFGGVGSLSVQRLGGATPSPRAFSMLPRGCDLKQSPANWAPAPPHPPVSAVQIAESLLELLGSCEGRQPDAIAAAETLKKLLKSASGRHSVSLAVHRIGNTLLLDEFAMPPPLLGMAAGADVAQFKRWVMERLGEAAGGEQTAELRLPRSAAKKNPALQARELLRSKFLARSVLAPTMGGGGGPPHRCRRRATGGRTCGRSTTCGAPSLRTCPSLAMRSTPRCRCGCTRPTRPSGC